MMENEAKYCDHTVLKAYATQGLVKKFCDEAKDVGAAAVCVNPVHVAFVKGQLEGAGIKTCAVVGFPLGANKPVIKAAEAFEAIQDGADEVDMVINIGALRDGDADAVYEDIKAVVDAANGRAIVKVIIETCYLTKEQKMTACRLCQKAGADYVKTSTGFGTGGATAADVALMRSVVGDRMKIKASGGIYTREDAIRMMEAGADRIGTSKATYIAAGSTTVPCATDEAGAPQADA
jgi:deoxyribose-phosphate aldolase